MHLQLFASSDVAALRLVKRMFTFTELLQPQCTIDPAPQGIEFSGGWLIRVNYGDSGFTVYVREVPSERAAGSPGL